MILVSLAGDFAVWAASKESEFLGSGRLVWAHWDVDELKQLLSKAGEEHPAGRKFTLGLLGWAV